MALYHGKKLIQNNSFSGNFIFPNNYGEIYAEHIDRVLSITLVSVAKRAISVSFPSQKP